MNNNTPPPAGSPPPQKGQTAPATAAADADAPNGKFVSITLDEPIRIGDTAIETITLRKPMAGELRGLTLDDLIASDIGTLLKLIPRISSPILTEDIVAAQLSPVDLGQMGGAVRGFFMTKGQHETLKQMIEDSSQRN